MKLPDGLIFSPLSAIVPAAARSFSVSYGELLLSDLGAFYDYLPQDLEKAADKRKIDFITGRICAAQALSVLDPHRQWPNIGRCSDRSPVWPVGIVGSITHTDGFTSATVGLAKDFESIGIDSETIMSTAQAEKIKDKITSPAECSLAQSHGIETGPALAMIFSAKESLFKCLYPLVNIHFGFHDARLQALDPDHGSFSIELLRDLTERFPQGTTFTGNVVFSDELVVTGISI